MFRVITRNIIPKAVDLNIGFGYFGFVLLFLSVLVSSVLYCWFLRWSCFFGSLVLQLLGGAPGPIRGSDYVLRPVLKKLDL